MYDEMKAEELTHILRDRLQEQLPGEPAQYLMAPEGRRHKAPDRHKSKLGGVLVFIYPIEGEWHLLLTQRAEYPGVHSGQVSFPGGRMEHEDLDLTMTALRETEEETGVEPNRVAVIGELSHLYIPPSNFMVYPFVGIGKKKPVFNHDPVEVKTIIEVPLYLLLRNDIRNCGPIRLSSGKTINCPYFALKGFTVWGATAMILSEFITLLSKPEPVNTGADEKHTRS